MGNTQTSPNSSQKAKHIVEVKVSLSHIDLPAGRDGLPVEVAAKIGDASLGRYQHLDVSWLVPTAIPLMNDDSVILVSLYTVEAPNDESAVKDMRLFSEICIPSCCGVAGLAEFGVHSGGPPVTYRLPVVFGAQYENGMSPEKLASDFRSAMNAYRPDRPSITVEVRLLKPAEHLAKESASVDESPPLTVLQSRRQVIALELQNAALAARQGAGRSGEEIPTPTHVKQLQMIQQENEQLRTELNEMRRRQEMVDSVLEGRSNGAGTGRRNTNHMLWVYEKELEHYKVRRQKIQENFEDRVKGLQSQIAQAADERLAEAQISVLEREAEAMGLDIDEAMTRRDSLLREWRDVRESVQGPVASAEVQRALAQSREAEAELGSLQQELALRKEKEKGSTRSHEMQESLAQLNEELDEFERMRGDERVRSESEIRELKSERDSLKDRLDDLLSEHVRLNAKAEALRGFQAEIEATSARTADKLSTLTAENAKLTDDLAEVQMIEEQKNETILWLERSQDDLIQMTSMESLRVVPPAECSSTAEDVEQSLAMHATELRKNLDMLQRSCETQRETVENLRLQTEATEARSRALRETYAAYHQRSHEMVLKDPVPVRRHSRPGTAATLSPASAHSFNQAVENTGSISPTHHAPLAVRRLVRPPFSNPQSRTGTPSVAPATVGNLASLQPKPEIVIRPLATVGNLARQSR
eukprot:TRINITY_DN20632_c0_g1_i1.p1 TRINITY_DN20632_c0_g1~~TRINITY_DN20632_c0_g1_i1.p1  ORF type:complete len:702 (+),score=120.61 TRINITY_DN20632_c0_g1_i1:156-2261(+)